MATVRANAPAVVIIDGFPTPIAEGQAFDSEDDTVRKFPWLFIERDVESATAGPGERRGTRK